MKVRGYALLTVLPALLVMTVFSTSLIPANVVININHLESLADAKHRLLAYSASYADIYNATGAGPGHLPCPDTDITPDSYQVQLGLNSDGPNPPCGKHSIAIGKLPRHISHAKQRYAFHLEDKHDLWYAVDTRFINNPVNRVVTPDTVGRIHWHKQKQAVALVFKLKEGSGFKADILAGDVGKLRQALLGGSGAQELAGLISHSVMITPTALMSVVTARVALWMEDMITNHNNALCEQNKACIQLSGLRCAVALQDKLLLSVLDNANDLSCTQSAADVIRVAAYVNDAYLDGVLFRQHWFYRNRWWHYVEVEVSPRCVESSEPCRIHLSKQDGEKPIQLSVR